jgi:hypothetical protein
MAKKNDQSKENDLTLLKVKRDREWETAQNNRKEIDWQWFMYDLWVSGNHYAKWDKNTQQIVTTVRDKGRVKIVINKVYSTLRSVRNFVLRNRPKAETTPDNLTEENLDQVSKLNKFLDFLHDKLKFRTKLKGTLWHALKYSVGFWQVIWDEDEEEIAVNMVDPYDLYWDPVAKSPEEARYCVLAVRRNVEDLKNDPKYNFKDIKGDDLLAASSMKARLLQAEKGMQSFGESKGTSTVIVREHWYWDTQETEEEDEKGKKTKKKERKLMLCAIAGDKIIREPEDTGLTRFPFFKLPSDVEPLSMYGTGWVKNLISPNRALDRLESQVAEYNDIMNRGKWIADKGSGVRVINNENGQIIEKKRGYDVTQGAISPLSAAIFQQIDNMNTYIEDLGGAHDASLGRIPSGAKSGKALEALQVGDSNNMSEIVENVEEFLEEVYEYILSIASQKYQFARTVIPTTRSGEREFIQVIGESAKDIAPEGTLVIPSKNTVDVKITSWLAFTDQARQEILNQLFSIRAIDQQTLLEGYNIGSVSEILKKTKEQQLRQAATDIEVGKQEQIAGAEAQAEGTAMNGGAGKKEAIAVIRAILQGEKPPTLGMVTPEFLQYFDAFLSGPEAKGLGPELLQAITEYRDQMVMKSKSSTS